MTDEYLICSIRLAVAALASLITKVKSTAK
uniref:Uncharacterized protein n=1 Tax=Arundo donax TaxID=35708 RepID=A0A0A9EP35_ARUDO